VENGYIVISRYLLKAIDPWSVQCVDWRIKDSQKWFKNVTAIIPRAENPAPTQGRAVIGNKEHGNVPLKILESFIIKPYAQMAT
jgi:hypothetical protein